ncbi:phosphoribosylanthranilate isomerase [Granulosicoccus sp.]|nr:phosphoribosylanthranilate isomerase [Granulosicoccus sp.]MDB4223604.1 phosphoribosylanthranilate isomerase [Granulosicoccus sp.]
MAPRTRVKICGITRLQDANMAQALGADSLGFVFVPASKRYIEPKAALEIVSTLYPFVTCVGLFLNADAQDVRHVLSLMPSMMPQFHGQETAEYCDQFERPYLKAVGVGGGMPTSEELSVYRHCSGFLFDSNAPGELGGTGHAFDWSQLSKNFERPLILAGGINVQNVERAIKEVAPHAIDISSGVEVRKGIKDPEAMKLFMAAVSKADNVNQ